MPNTRGRIEREYILASLNESKTPLSVVSEGRVFEIAPGLYKVYGNGLSIANSNSSGLSSPIRVYFNHKNSLMYFDAVRKNSSGTFFLENAECGGMTRYEIGLSIYRSDADERILARTNLVILSEEKQYQFCETSEYPLDCIDQDEAILLQKKEQLTKIADKVGLPKIAETLAGVRLFKYLEAISHKKKAFVEHNVLLYIDHRVLFVSQDASSPISVSGVCTMRVTWIKPGQHRLLVCKALKASTVPINKKCNLVFFEICDAEEEDKRFLYETVHKRKYTGE